VQPSLGEYKWFRYKNEALTYSVNDLASLLAFCHSGGGQLPEKCPEILQLASRGKIKYLKNSSLSFGLINAYYLITSEVGCGVS